LFVVFVVVFVVLFVCVCEFDVSICSVKFVYSY